MFNPTAIMAAGVGKSVYDQYKKTSADPEPNTYYGAIERQKLKAVEAADQSARNQISQNYESGKQTLGSQAATQSRNLSEYLSQRGMQNAGVGAQAEINTSGSLISGIASLKNQQAQALNEQEATYQSGIASAQEDAYNKEMTVINNGAYDQDLQAEINRRTAIDPNDPVIQVLKGRRYTKVEGLKTAAADAKQQEFDNWYKTQSLNRSGGGGSGSDGMTDAAYRKWALDKATSGGVFIQETFDQLMSMRNETPKPTRNANYDDLTKKLSSMSNVLGRKAWIQYYNEQGKISDIEAQNLLDQYVL